MVGGSRRAARRRGHARRTTCVGSGRHPRLRERRGAARQGRSAVLAGRAWRPARVPASRRLRPGRPIGVDRLDATLAKVTDAAPVILLAHEPDIAVKVPDRVTLMLSGHTHGGQVRLLGWSPWVPSRYGNRFAYGHVRERCDMIVSGGLGCSIMPVRLGVPPEIVLVSLRGGNKNEPGHRVLPKRLNV